MRRESNYPVRRGSCRAPPGRSSRARDRAPPARGGTLDARFRTSRGPLEDAVKLTGERPMEGATPDSLLALHDAGYREVIARLGPGVVLDVGCGVGTETSRLAAPDRLAGGRRPPHGPGGPAAPP